MSLLDLRLVAVILGTLFCIWAYLAPPSYSAPSPTVYIEAGGHRYGVSESALKVRRSCESVDLEEILGCVADEERRVIISVVDLSFIPEVVNLWETSLAPLGLTNYLVICTSENCGHAIQQLGLPMWLMDAAKDWDISNTTDWDEASAYKGKNYAAKTYSKVGGVIEILKLNYTALLVDPDIHFFNDPLPLFDCTNCDVEFSSDRGGPNSGLYFARPTPGALALHARVWAAHKKRETAQTTFNAILDKKRAMKNEMCKSGRPVKVRIYRQTDFADGRWWTEPITKWFSPTTIHNNFVVGELSKQAHAKYMKRWLVDVDYDYSGPHKFLMVMFPEPGPTVPRDLWPHKMDSALLSAISLAKAMGRHLVFPKDWYSNSCDCWKPIIEILEIPTATWYHEWNYFEHPKRNSSYSMTDILALHGTSSDFSFVKTPQLSALNSANKKSAGPPVDASLLRALPTLLNDHFSDLDVIRLAHLYTNAPVDKTSKLGVRGRRTFKTLHNPERMDMFCI